MRQIIILDSTPTSGGSNVRYAFWVTANPGAAVPLPTFVSAFRDALADEQEALRAGKVVEGTGTFFAITGSSLQDVQVALIPLYQTFRTNTGAVPNPNVFFGSAWDGTSWK